MALIDSENSGEASPQNSTPDLQLTPREQAIALGLSQGLTDQEIARALKDESPSVSLEIESCMLKIGLDPSARLFLRPLAVSPDAGVGRLESDGDRDSDSDSDSESAGLSGVVRRSSTKPDAGSRESDRESAGLCGVVTRCGTERDAGLRESDRESESAGLSGVVRRSGTKPDAGPRESDRDSGRATVRWRAMLAWVLTMGGLFRRRGSSRNDNL
jgi:hypothetical protein